MKVITLVENNPITGVRYGIAEVNDITLRDDNNASKNHLAAKRKYQAHIVMRQAQSTINKIKMQRNIKHK